MAVGWHDQRQRLHRGVRDDHRPLFVVELVIVGLVVLLGIVLRILLRRPWLVDAVPVGEPGSHLTCKVVGLAASKRALDDIVPLAAGVELPHVQGAELARQSPPR